MARKTVDKNLEQDSENEDSEQEYEDSEQEIEGNEEESSEDEREKNEKLAKMKRDLAHVSFEQLAEINGKIDSSNHGEKKKISKAQILKDLEGTVGKIKKKNKVKLTKDDMKRENKQRPMEMSSKKAVGRFRNVVSLQSEKTRDPRFDKLSGNFNQDLYEKSYGFLKEYNKSEMEMLKNRIKKEKDVDTRESLKMMLTKMVSSEKTEEDKKRKQNLIRERKKQESELVKQGKKPFFLKNSEKRKLELMDRYKNMGDKAVDRVLEKRRKRNTTKDRKRLPFKRRSAE